ncbi:MAG: glycosyltransferase family 2 protein [Candidatus Electrothrix sp. GW3-4]|uniref:glycosyltransferase family 2 protein n=1 Tax=Candidatus Electrothrix sp. GW3-4 TaxID=3126740 RepID=UPI0030D5A764
MDSENPFITVIIPVYNEEKFIVKTLDQIYQQDYSHDRMEVIVVDGMSTDRTGELIKDFKHKHNDLDIRLFENPKRLSSAARNIAIRNSKGDYCLLIDGHVHIPTNSMLSHYANAAITNDAKVIGRPQPLTPPHISNFQKAVTLARSSRLAHSPESYIYDDFSGWVSPISCAVFYHKEIFEKIGYFDENFDAAEDYEFNYRIEKEEIECYIASNLAVNYYPRDSLSSVYRQMFRYGHGRAMFIIKHSKRLTIDTIVPSAFVIYLLTLMSISLIFSSSLLLWCPMILYVLLLGVEEAKFVKCLRVRDNPKILLIPTIIFTVHVGLGLGFLEGLMRHVTSHFKGDR